MSTSTSVPDRLAAAVELLRQWGYKVTSVSGWRTRKASTIAFAPAGVIVHHTGSAGTPDSTLIQGRSDLPGPLCHLSVHRDGTIAVIAAGYANHAGINNKASVERVLAGGATSTIIPGADTAGYSANRRTIGIEAAGATGWTATQHRSMVAACAALTLAFGWSRTRPPVGAHKEITRRKPLDPYGVHMGAFRSEVAAQIKARTAPASVLTLRVASINVRSADPKISAGGAKTWPARAKDLIAAIVAADAAVILCQETVEDQRDAIRAALPGGPARWLVWVRRGQAIIWDSQRLTHGPKTDILVNTDGYHGAVATTVTDRATGLQVTVCSAHVAPVSVIPAGDKAKVQRTQTEKIVTAVDDLADGGVRIIGGDFNNTAAPSWAAPYWDANTTAKAAGTVRDAPTRDTRRIDLLLYRMGSRHTISCRGYGHRNTKTGSDHTLIVTSLRITRKPSPLT